MQVAPFTGAWIEMERYLVQSLAVSCVAPFTGAWIEMHRSIFARA